MMRFNSIFAGLIATFVAGNGSFAETNEIFTFGAMDSGGGHAIVCRENTGISRVLLFDYFEAQVLDGLTLSPTSGSVEEQARALLARIPSVDKDRHAEYAQLIGEFFVTDPSSRTVAYVRGVDLPFFDDSASGITPSPECRLEQLAIKREPQFEGDPRFIVDGDLWDLLSDSDKAGLILHEIIYQDARELGATDSRRARHFNSLIASDRWQTFTTDPVGTLSLYSFSLDELKLPSSYTIDMQDANGSTQPVFLDLRGIEFYDIAAGSVAVATVNDAKNADPLKIVRLVTCKQTFNVFGPITENQTIRFHENGCLAGIEFNREIPELPRARFYWGIEAKVESIAFLADGTPSCAVLGESVQLRTTSGSPLFFRRSNRVMLDDQARVSSYDDAGFCD